MTVFFFLSVVQLSESSSSSAFSCSSTHSLDLSSLGVSPVTSTPSLPPFNKKCFDYKERSSSSGYRDSVFMTPITSKVLPPPYNQQQDDACIIRISTEDDNGNMYRSILVSGEGQHNAVLVGDDFIQGALNRHGALENPSPPSRLITPGWKGKIPNVPLKICSENS